MTLRKLLAIVLLLWATCVSGFSRDTRHMYPLEKALGASSAREKLGSTVAFYFGNRKPPGVARTLGEYVANRKTNAANKSDQEACEWAFLSALLSLRDRALQEGGDAVVGISSYYRKNEVVSDTEYECHAGGFVAGVALKGVVVKLAR